MTSRRPVAGRVPEQTFQQIEALAEQRGTTRAEVVASLLSGALPTAPAEPPGTRAADEQHELEMQWTRPTYVAEQLKLAIENPEVFGRMYGRREFVMEVLPWRKTALDMFGKAVLLAATRRSADCKWCAADRYARRHRLPAPPINTATRILLGPQCEKCDVSAAQRRAKIRTLTARARSRSTETRALSQARVVSSYWTPLLREAEVSQWDDQGRPMRLITQRDGSGKRRILVREGGYWQVIQ